MDFDIGNILYIVITLVVVIVGLMGKKKKPAQGGGGEGSSQTAAGFLENLEKAFNMGKEEQAVMDLGDYEEDLPFEDELVEETPVKEPETMTLMEEYERMMERRQATVERSSIQERIDNMEGPMEIIDIDEEKGVDEAEEIDYLQLGRNFDAGKAIIYASIINRIDY